MIERENVLIGLHCMGQDLMIDPPPCDGCRYQVQMVNRMGCDFRQLCRDAIAIINDDDNQMHHLQMIVEEYEKVLKQGGWML